MLFLLVPISVVVLDPTPTVCLLTLAAIFVPLFLAVGPLLVEVVPSTAGFLLLSLCVKHI